MFFVALAEKNSDKKGSYEAENHNGERSSF